MDLRDYVRLLRRRWRLIALCALLAVGAAVGATLLQAKVYTARIQLFVSAQDRAAGGDISSAYTGGLFTQQRVKSYVDVLQSPRVGQLVVADLGLHRSPEQVAGAISATAPLDTVLINVAVADRDPALAQRIANSVGGQFPRLVADLERPAGGGPAPVKVSVIQPAQLPTAPTSPRPTLNLALGLLVGLAVGVGGAVLRETLDTTVKSPEEAADLIGAPLLGMIGFDADSRVRPLIVHVEPRSPRAEAFRQLRTNLQFVDVDRPVRSVVVTSALPEEGKSTASCNLAISMAQTGKAVILVEGDLRRPRIASYLGLEGAVGLTSVLTGQVDLEDALQPWGDGGLRVLPSGPLPPNPSELLGSHGMEQLLRRLESLSDQVVIDAPPLLPVTDAAVLGARTSGVLMMVRSGKTTRDQLVRAAQTLQGVGASILGAVLNMVPQTGPDAYQYGYGYYGKAARSPVRSTEAAGLGQAAPTSVPAGPASGGPDPAAPPSGGPDPAARPSGVSDRALDPPPGRRGARPAAAPDARPGTAPGARTGARPGAGPDAYPAAVRDPGPDDSPAQASPARHVLPSWGESRPGGLTRPTRPLGPSRFGRRSGGRSDEG